MKVCFISHSSATGGAELSMLDLIEAIRHRGIRSCCVLPNEGPLTSLLASKGIEFSVVPYKQWVHTNKTWLGSIRKMWPLRQLPGIVRLAREIKRSDCDVVVTNTIAVGAGAIAARIASRAHVWHIREFGYDDHKLRYDWGRKISRGLIRRLSTSCIANSEAVAADYRPDLRGTEVATVYNSVVMPDSADGSTATGPWRDQKAIRCVLLGKWLAGKGHEDAVRAMVRLRKMNIHAELMIIGGVIDSSYRRHVESIIVRNRLTDRVHMLDHCNDPMPLMRSADIALVCSRREAFGRVTVEAMKLGKPVVATRSGGTPEIVVDGQTGYLYPPGDADELATRIRSLCDSRSKRETMGRAALRRSTELFNQEAYAGGFERVVRRIVDRPTGRRPSRLPPSEERGVRPMRPAA